MSENDKDEFRNAIRQIGYYSMRLENPYEFGRVLQRVLRDISVTKTNLQALKILKQGKLEDRVRVSEWVRKLIRIDDDCMENVKKKNEYIQFLRIQVTQAVLQLPFTKPPPEGEIPPLPELLGNLMCQKIPGLPKPGPISPAVIHKSPDGRAYISIKHVPGNGILCYMAVTPDSMDIE